MRCQGSFLPSAASGFLSVDLSDFGDGPRPLVGMKEFKSLVMSNISSLSQNLLLIPMGSQRSAYCTSTCSESSRFALFTLSLNVVSLVPLFRGCVCSLFFVNLGDTEFAYNMGPKGADLSADSALTCPVPAAPR